MIFTVHFGAFAQAEAVPYTESKHYPRRAHGRTTPGLPDPMRHN